MNIEQNCGAKEPFPAHIRKDGDELIIQPLADHSRKVAIYAAENLSDVGLYNVGYLCGLLHDMGKATEKFGNYIYSSVRGEKTVKGSVIHTFTGCIWLFERQTSYPCANRCKEILAYSIAAHHGLIDCIKPDGKSELFYRISYDKKELCYDESVKNFFDECVDVGEIEEIYPKAESELSKFLNNIGADKQFCNYKVGLLVRMICSALMDADRRDTKEFMENSAQINQSCDKNFWDERLCYAEKQLVKMTANAPKNELNDMRAKISQKCYDIGAQPDGIYRLCLPTGSGKTFAAMRYALRHAREYEKKRIFYVAPLLTILDQNSKQIKKLVGDDYVLEHSSDVIIGEMNDEDKEEYKCLIENWNSPIIITTLVQFLNALFSGKTGSVRRMNALCNSIVIIDEIQSLPLKVKKMTNIAINFLSKYFGVSFVICSATQPTKLISDAELDVKPENIVTVSSLAPFRRASICDKTSVYGYSIEDLSDMIIEKMGTKDSLLFVCNTKKTASELFTLTKQKIIANKSNIDIYSLSAAMCKKHRCDTLDLINNSLRKKPIICISTQVVEAGVDFSFECVVRSLAGIDNIAQAAGRCNRSWEYDYPCEVFIVNVKSENLSCLKEIDWAKKAAISTLYQYRLDDSGNDLTQKIIDRYYDNLYKDANVTNVSEYPCKIDSVPVKLFDILSINNGFARTNGHYGLLKQAFKTAGNIFSVFDENTTDVIVPYNTEAENIISDLGSERAEYDVAFVRKCLEKAKPYVVSVYQYQRDRLAKNGKIFSPNERLSDKLSIFVMSKDNYSLETGVKEINANEIYG